MLGDEGDLIIICWSFNCMAFHFVYKVFTENHNILAIKSNSASPLQNIIIMQYLAGLLVIWQYLTFSLNCCVKSPGRGLFGKILTTQPPGSVGPGMTTK